jgi:hypothetical protein
LNKLESSDMTITRILLFSGDREIAAINWK